MKGGNSNLMLHTFGKYLSTVVLGIQGKRRESSHVARWGHPESNVTVDVSVDFGQNLLDPVDISVETETTRQLSSRDTCFFLA